jgi:hypothetical protein
LIETRRHFGHYQGKVLEVTGRFESLNHRPTASQVLIFFGYCSI